MYITAGKIYRDTKNFFRYQLLNILLISIFCSFITILINYFFTPSTNQLLILSQNENINYTSIFDRIQKMNIEQHQILLSIAFAGTISSLIGNSLLTSSILLLIINLSTKKDIILFDIISLFIKIVPKLLMLIFFITLIVQFGFMILLLPGIMFTIILSLSPTILVISKTSIFNSVYNSIKLVFKNIKLIVPAVVLWILVKVMLIIFISVLYSILPYNVLAIVFNTISYFVLSILIIYLTRLYILLNKNF